MGREKTFFREGVNGREKIFLKTFFQNSMEGDMHGELQKKFRRGMWVGKKI